MKTKTRKVDVLPYLDAKLRDPHCRESENLRSPIMFAVKERGEESKMRQAPLTGVGLSDLHWFDERH
jgi:hypothetical protein